MVIERNVVDGQGFKAGDVLFRIADHSVVWVMADVAEGDIGCRAGQADRQRDDAGPSRPRRSSGNVAVVYPHLMKETRTARVRIELPNPDLALLPDMYADVEIATGCRPSPWWRCRSSAVIDSGSRQVVLARPGRRPFRAARRQARAARRRITSRFWSGVAEGDSVVVNGNFLIDAESNLQAALKGLTAPPTTEASQ